MDFFTLFLFLLFSPSNPKTINPLIISKWEVRLGSDTFWEREKAEQDLRREASLGDSICFNLLSEESKDPEVRARVKRVYEDLLEKKLDKYEPYPQLDSLWFVWGQWYECCETNVNYKNYSYYFRKLLAFGLPHDANTLSLATRCWFSDLVQHDTPDWQLTMIWYYMHALDYKIAYGVWQVNYATWRNKKINSIKGCFDGKKK